MKIERRGHEWPPQTSFIPGRWQPLHDGHEALIRVPLAEGRDVVIGIMDTELSTRNLLSVASRHIMFHDRFPEEIKNGRIKLVTIPWVDEFVYGRDCGWRCRAIQLDAETEAISATGLRAIPHCEQVRPAPEGSI